MFVVNVLTVVAFSGVYYSFRQEENWNGMTEDSPWYDCFYFSFTTMTTIGYGDISPKSALTKTICIVQQLIVLFQLANILSKIAIQKSRLPKIRLKPKSRLGDMFKHRNQSRRNKRHNSCQLDYVSRPVYEIESEERV